MSGKSEDALNQPIRGSVKVEVRRRKTSASQKWDDTNDPFQVFEVEHEACWDLEITVVRGEGITKGSFMQDLMDTPDPYIVLCIPGSSNSSKRTSHVDNDINPIWNETFHFFLEPRSEYELRLTLMDANFSLDETLGECTLDLSSLQVDEEIECVFDTGGGSKIFTQLSLSVNKTPDLRFSLALCEEEKNFLRNRRDNVKEKLQNMLGEDGPRNKQEVPTIAVLGSGGGFRAMICMSGVVKALHQSGFLACCAYICGLSGSSWLISTLYAHDNFPNVTYEEFNNQLCNSVSSDWKWQLKHCISYATEMIMKYRQKQPVSFTDFFGHLLGDVILNGRKDKKLSDQQKLLTTGLVPFPLYTCLHAKASVSCRAFSEWVEFSPYEIGIAKYGTFMKTEHFGSKFLFGKLIRQHPEFPLHFLQGVWGSAFTILFKRLILDKRPKQDLVQMMRDINDERAVHEKLEEECLFGSSIEKESDTDGEEDIDGEDDLSSDDSSSHFDNDLQAEDTKQEDTSKIPPSSHIRSSHPVVMKRGSKSLDVPDSDISVTFKKSPEQERKSSEPTRKVSLESYTKFNFDFVQKVKKASDKEKVMKEDNGMVGSAMVTGQESRQNRLIRQNAVKPLKRVKIEKQNTLPEAEKTPIDSLCTRTNSGAKQWRDRRKKRQSIREERSSVFQTFQSMMMNSPMMSGIVNSRAGRAGEILNPFRGLSMRNALPISPFTSTNMDEEEVEENEIRLGKGCRYESLDQRAKKLFIVDSGLAFNSPFPLLLRPQRGVNIYLSFDFSQRPYDNAPPFKELLLAEEWAKQNEVKFPPIKQIVDEIPADETVKELYIFKNENDIYCPVVMHFPLVNNKFKEEKEPGVPRETDEEKAFANFELFPKEGERPFETTKFVYTPFEYERLVKLCEFNTASCLPYMKEEFAKMVKNKRKMDMSSVKDLAVNMSYIMKATKMFKGRRSSASNTALPNSLKLKMNQTKMNILLGMWKPKRRRSAKESNSIRSNCSDEYYDAIDDTSDIEEYDDDDDEEEFEECIMGDEAVDDGDEKSTKRTDSIDEGIEISNNKESNAIDGEFSKESGCRCDSLSEANDSNESELGRKILEIEELQKSILGINSGVSDLSISDDSVGKKEGEIYQDIEFEL